MRPVDLELDSVSFAYPDGTPALEGVSLRVARGECLGLVGANGAGKSSLLALVSGLEAASSGLIRVGELVLGRSGARELRRTLGLSFQDPDDQLFSASVREDVAFGPRNLGLSEPEVEARTARALEAVGAAHLADRPPYRLSGGEKRAAALATVLAMEPGLLLLDEPTAGLDPRARRGLMRLVRSLPQTRLVASHDLDLVLELCDRVVVLARGKVAAEGLPGEVLLDEGLMERCGLELPLGAREPPARGRAGRAGPAGESEGTG